MNFSHMFIFKRGKESKDARLSWVWVVHLAINHSLSAITIKLLVCLLISHSLLYYFWSRRLRAQQPEPEQQLPTLGRKGEGLVTLDCGTTCVSIVLLMHNGPIIFAYLVTPCSKIK